jgi:hypothetical protein
MVSEDGEKWGKFDIGSGLAPGRFSEIGLEQGNEQPGMRTIAGETKPGEDVSKEKHEPAKPKQEQEKEEE